MSVVVHGSHTDCVMVQITCDDVGAIAECAGGRYTGQVFCCNESVAYIGDAYVPKDEGEGNLECSLKA